MYRTLLVHWFHIYINYVSIILGKNIFQAVNLIFFGSLA